MPLTRDEKLARGRRWYAKNIDRERARARRDRKRWREANPEKSRAACRASSAKRRLTADGRAAALLNACRRRAQKKGLPFNLTKDWIAEKIRGGCELTGISFVLNGARGAGKRHAFTPSIDRKILSAGYVQENCRVIVWCLNAALATWGESDLFTAVDAWRSRRV